MKTKNNLVFGLLFALTFFSTSSKAQWLGTSVLYPTGTSNKVLIGSTTNSEATSKLTVVGGNIEIKNGYSLKSNDGYGLNINPGNSIGAISPVLNLFGSLANSPYIPGSVYISSGPTLDGIAQLSSAPLEVGWNAIAIGGADCATLRSGGYKLGVYGNIIAEQIVVKTYSKWPDFVFAKDYALSSLSDLERFILENKHLPGIPSQKELGEKDGINISDMFTAQMQKIEELTLYLIGQDKKIKELENRLKELKKDEVK